MEQYVKQKLYELFHYDSFRTGQLEIILDILNGKDVFGILPTGTGKSLCYQLPSKILPGLTIVISPLISLMVDQVRETKAYYFKEVAALHSFQSSSERNVILENLAQYKLIYLSPELLQQQKIINRLKKVNISLFVIDEAHCISQWGHDFRPDYLRLKQIIPLLGRPPILALTGTATEKVIEDVIRQLGLNEMSLHQYSVERENIGLIVEHIERNHESKDDRLIEIIEMIHEPTIIYFSSRKTTEKVARLLEERFTNRRIAYYHGGMDAASRLKIQQQFTYDQLDIVCATSAFGMGINKKNIRFVIHYHLPAQIESFIQEIGRAGRDGLQSYSILLFEKGDEHVPLSLIENELPTAKEIDEAFTYLYTCYEKGVKADELEKDFTTHLSISETKIRFLLYHFETNGMIKDNKIYYDRTDWDEANEKINSFCNKWTTEKHVQFQKMLSFVETKQCLRKNIYKHFMKEVSRKEKRCCSNCNLDINELKSKEKNVEVENRLHWQKQLAYILGIEANDETRRISKTIN